MRDYYVQRMERHGRARLAMEARLPPQPFYDQLPFQKPGAEVTTAQVDNTSAPADNADVQVKPVVLKP